MTLWLLLESALRSFALAAAVWIGLKALRVRNPQVELTAWTVVLAAALAMPLLLQVATVTIPERLPVPASVATIITAQPVSLEAPPLAADQVIPPVSQAVTVQPFDWATLTWKAYLLVAGMLLLRMAVGIAMTWRLARAARRVRVDWAAGSDVRISDAIGMPVTFGRVILLPADCAGWSAFKRQAVLSHERSHVARGDYPVLLLAALHSALFWFNPLSWWLLSRLAVLMEAASDDAAIAALRDRVSYAEVLLDIASRGGRTPAGVAMARPATVAGRVARILRENALPARFGWRGRALVVASLLPATAMAAITISQSVPTECLQPYTEAMPLLRAAELAPVSPDRLTLNSLVPAQVRFKAVPVAFKAQAAFAAMPVAPAVAQIQATAPQPLAPADVQLPASPQAADMTGTWSIFGLPPPIRMQGDVGPGLRPESCTFRQTGNALSGTCRDSYFENAVTGSVTGRTVHFDWLYWEGLHPNYNPAFNTFRASFDGTIGPDNVLRGKYRNAFAYRPEPGIYPGTFRAVKQVSDPS